MTHSSAGLGSESNLDSLLILRTSSLIFLNTTVGEEAPAGYSRENVCQWTTLFEALSPLETCFYNKERETSTNHTLDEL